MSSKLASSTQRVPTRAAYETLFSNTELSTEALSFGGHVGELDGLSVVQALSGTKCLVCLSLSYLVPVNLLDVTFMRFWEILLDWVALKTKNYFQKFIVHRLFWCVYICALTVCVLKMTTFHPNYTICPHLFFYFCFFFVFCFQFFVTFSVCYCVQHRAEYRKVGYIGDQRGWLAVFRVHCSSRELRFNSQYPYGSLQPAIILFPGHLTPSSDLCRHQVCTWCPDVHGDKTSMHIY